MRTLRLKSVAFLGALAIALGACGGGAPGGGDPVGTVNAAFSAAESGGFGALAAFACAAKKDDVTGLFGAGGMDELTAAGIDPNALFAAMKIDFQDLKTTEKSRDGSTAVVQVTGKASMQIDDAKFKEIMKKVLEAQGQPVPDAQLDQMIAAMSGSLTTTQDIDEEVTVVNEGGKWLICD